MTAKAPLFLSALLALSFGCAAARKPGDCSASSDCASQSDFGRVCVEGRCLECGRDDDCKSGFHCQAGACRVAAVAERPITPASPAPAPAAPPQSSACESLAPVHFGFNEYLLAPDERSILERDAVCLRALGAGSATVAGHADERGTEEYNLQLGERRATTVKKYLVGLGTHLTIRTTSLGEERPVNPGHDERAWAENRRAEIELQH